MKKILIGAGLVSALLALPLMASAAQFRADQQISISSGETIQGNTYLAGGNISSAGSVRGDLVVGGGNITVSGPVANDLLVGGGSIVVTSDIGGDVRIGGGNITVQGKVAGDAVIGGGQIHITGGGVGGDVAIGGGSVTISAPVNGNVKIGGGQITIDAPVKGNVQIMADKVTLGPKAVISGSLTYTASAEATMQQGAKVNGEIDFTKRDTRAKAAPAAIGALFTIALLMKLLMMLAGAFVFFWLFPKYAHTLVVDFAERPLENLGYGFVGFVVMPVAAIVLFATIIGIPLGAIVLLSYIVLVIFSALVAPVAIGSLVHKLIWKPNTYVVDWKTILLGVAIYFIVGLIPFLGGLAKFIVIVMTFGIVIRIKWNAVKNWR